MGQQCSGANDTGGQTLDFAPDENKTRSFFTEVGQGHVFNGFEELDETAKQNLLSQCGQFDVRQVNQLYEELVTNPSSSATSEGQDTFEPIEADKIKYKSELSDLDKTVLEANGKALIKEGKVGVVILAGGQGSRLGFDGPKGKYDVGLPSGKTLFQILTERFFKAQLLAHEVDVEEGEDQGKPIAIIPASVQKCKMFVMTSYENHAETEKFFKDNGYFGGDQNSFVFFTQSMLPALTTDGKIMMSSQSSLKLAPNGNGAFFDALAKNEQLRSVIKEMEYLQIIGVDNILNKVLDPIQVGYTSSEKLLCSCKAVGKRDAQEKVGVIGKKNGLYNIVEYSELPEEQAQALGDDGKLKFNQGSILIFMINANYLIQLVTSSTAGGNSLYHKAFKKVSHVDPESWDEITPDAENAWKFELFLHNFMPSIPDGQLGVLMVDRETEFAPVKNADGPDASSPVPDSPACARMMLLKESSTWISSVQGLQVDGNVVGNIEVSPLLSYAGENLNWLKHIYKRQSISGPTAYLNHTGQQANSE